VPSTLRARAAELRRGPMPPSGWTFLAFAGRAVFTTVVLVISARVLGAAVYGEFVGVSAYVLVVAPMALLGVDELLMQRVSVDAGSLGRAWGDVVLAAATTGVGTAVVLVLGATLVLPGRDLSLVGVVVATELLAAATTSVHARGFLALGRLPLFTLLAYVDGALRAAAAVAFWATGGRTVLGFAAWQLGAVVLAAAVSGVALARVAGGPRPAIGGLPDAFRTGSRYVAGTVAGTIQGGIDRTMLLREDLAVGAARYHAGLRLISYTNLPLMSILVSSRAEFFRSGDRGLDHSLAFARRIAPKVAVAAVGAGLGALALSPFAAFVLGGEFDGVVPVVALMAGLPLVQGLHALVGDALTGAGRQGARARSQFVAAGVNVALNAVLIPRHGVAGAMVATYVSEGVLLAVLLLVARRSLSR
jgi:O-antigen/teichoic acid export membrane protein